MTVINVAGLLQEHPGASRDYRLRDYYVSLGPEVDLAGPLNGSLRLQRTNRSILVRGAANALVRRTCGRCTDAYEDEASIRIEEEYLPSVDLVSGAPTHTGHEAEEVRWINERHEVDLTPVLREDFALTEPIVGLCRPDCPGLCPNCGRRLGTGHEDCTPSEPDERMAVLRRLLDPPTAE